MMTNNKSTLFNLLAAQDAIARLEAAAELASVPLRDGLRARLACREAAGWLAHHGSWVHPLDLALRADGLTGSYAAAELGTRLGSVLPVTLALGAPPAPPEDRDVATALRNADQWQRLAALRTWQPADVGALPDDDGTPALLAAARLATAPGGMRLTAAAVLRAAWLWRERGGTGEPGLLLWSAPVQRLHRAVLAADPLPPLLGAMAEAALAARRELARLRAAEARGRAIAVTSRSHLPQALDVVIARPVVTARMLADRLALSLPSAGDLLRQLVAAGVLREGTGRKSWRGFVVV
jgi:ribosomal protein S25